MNRQEIFNKVAAHLIKQGAVAWGLPYKSENCSYDGIEQCLYLDKDGNKCAIGALIPDGHKAQGSNLNVAELMYEFPDLAELLGLEKNSETGDFDSTDIEFFINLQAIHDNATKDWCSVEEWPNVLAEFAKRRGLNTDLVLNNG